ncbi:unnamed protein product [Leptosia nina]|uniref:C2H2-type domain-containing protein n=1 Tax=Leptosia nina TaxID=320188 RepID=A0AAV1K1N4_9NEOP
MDLEIIDDSFSYADADTVCNICFAEFLDTEDLQTHLFQVHANNERFCSYCVKILPDIEQFMMHIRDKHLIKMHWCKYCFRLFPDVESKLVHTKKHNYQPGMTIFCSQCSKCFDANNDITQHEYEHENVEGTAIYQGFSLLSSLLNMNVKEFLKSISNTSKKFVCACCKFACRSPQKFIEHSKKATCRSLVCDICCAVYRKRRHLIQHINGHNKKRWTNTCPKCNATFTWKGLREHKKVCYEIKCSDCHMQFESIEELTSHTSKEHVGTITVERCKFCEKQIIGKDMLKKHLQYAHKGTLHLYKYRCIDCDKLFKHPKLLFAHFFSTHKDLMPYTCKICNINFRVRKKFTLHVRLDHKSAGFVEFDENFHVYFVEKKSENPFVPKSIYFDEAIDDEKAKCIEGTDTDLTEDCTDTNDRKLTKKFKRKSKQKPQNIIMDSSDSDTPLLQIRRRRGPYWKTSHKNQPKPKFVCKICKKNCYTAQNFKYHMNTHKKRLRCIKCHKTFSTDIRLKRHIVEHHSSSKLIDTLKRIQERRKAIVLNEPPKNPFEDTLKKVHCVVTDTPAKLTLVKSNNVSVRNFYESFVPSKEKINIESSVTMRITSEHKEPVITLKKCRTDVVFYEGLKLPVEVPQCPSDTQATLKVVQGEIQRAKLNYGDRLYKEADIATMETDHSYCEEYFDCDQINGEEAKMIPEVAEEVMLSSEEPLLQQNIVLPNIPKVMQSIRIGTLQPQAPYYKILKIEDIIDNVAPMTAEEPNEREVKLDGIRLVRVNPLAHLVSETAVKHHKKRYYKPKERDIKIAMMKAMKVQPKRLRPYKRNPQINLHEEP